MGAVTCVYWLWIVSFEDMENSVYKDADTDVGTDVGTDVDNSDDMDVDVEM